MRRRQRRSVQISAAYWLDMGRLWLSIAAAGGNENAKANRKAVEKVMWPSQIVKAKEMARECEAKNYKGC